MLLAVLLNYRELNPEHVSKYFVGLSRGGRGFGVYRGIGRNFRKSISMLGKGAAWYSSAAFTGGNGAAMRIAPVALFYADDPVAMAHAVIKASIITHNDPVAISAALAVAFIVSRFARDGKPEDPAKLLLDASKFCHDHELLILEQYLLRYYPEFRDQYQTSLHLFSSGLEQLSYHSLQSFKSTLEWIAQAASGVCKYTIQRATVGYSLASVLYSIYVTLRHQDNFEEAVVEAVTSGGDTDTIGAITGAMAGALHGVSAIPRRWIENLINTEHIQRMAFALARGECLNVSIQDLYDMEKDIKDPRPGPGRR